VLKVDENILQKEITRKEFLAYMAAGLLSLFGVGNFIQLLLGHNLPSLEHSAITKESNSGAGFGTRRFGE
jgi:hypothetical protein